MSADDFITNHRADITKRPHSLYNRSIGDLAVKRYVFPDWDGRGEARLLLVRGSLDDLEIEGKPNMIFHTSFELNDRKSYQAAKDATERKFREYWDVPPFLVHR